MLGMPDYATQLHAERVLGLLTELKRQQHAIAVRLTRRSREVTETSIFSRPTLINASAW